MYEWEEINSEVELEMENLAKEIGRLWRQYKAGDIAVDEFLERVQTIINTLDL